MKLLMHIFKQQLKLNEKTEKYKIGEKYEYF